MTRQPAAVLLAGLAVLAAGAFILSAFSGSVSISAADVLSVFRGEGSDVARTVILELRLPRAAAAFVVGGLLALAGTLMQVLLRNPLADPYVLGVSGGAAVAALLAIGMGLGAIWIDAGAFAGALTISLLVFGLAHGPGGWTTTRLLLTGIVVASGLAAIISLLLALGDDTSLRGMLFWLMGDLSLAGWPLRSSGVLVLLVLLFFVLARPLNVLAGGEQQAALLGVAVKPLRIALFASASLATAVAVTTAGSIGFLGLVVPHMVRLVTGSDHRKVIPCAVLLGGSLLVLADVAARTVMAPRQLPVGALTALIGVPLFLYLMQRARHVN
ncbi:MAG: iron ABC transporter permease [Gammaproteobacteria bacterium]|nr:iron ABC transporter permease [Gammaproteobacteria bacterium]